MMRLLREGMIMLFFSLFLKQSLGLMTAIIFSVYSLHTKFKLGCISKSQL
jgi:hypothetical protein